MNTNWPSDLQVEQQKDSIILHFKNVYHLEEKDSNKFIGIPFVVIGLVGIISVLTEYFFSLISLMAFVPLVFITVGMMNLGPKNNVVKIIKITANQIIIETNQGIFKYFIADIKQFYVRNNGDLYAITEDVGREKHILFLREISKTTSFELAEALETHLDIYDIAVANEVRLSPNNLPVSQAKN